MRVPAEVEGVFDEVEHVLELREDQHPLLVGAQFPEQLVQQPELPGRVDERSERRLRRRPAGRRQRRRPRVAEVEVRVIAEQSELPAEVAFGGGARRALGGGGGSGRNP